MTFKEIPIDNILVKKNIRTDPDGELGGLMETIERHGLLQPVIVVPRDGSYELVSGHRRLEAMRARNEATVPCIIRDDLSTRDLPMVKLIENVQRKQLSSHELVEILDQMRAATPGITLAAIGRLMGKSPTWVALKYRAAEIYANLVEQGMPEAAVGELNDTELRRLARVTDPKERGRIARRAKGKGDIARAVKKASSFVPPKKNFRYDHTEYTGFSVTEIGKCTLQVLCGSESEKRQVSGALNRLAYEHIKLYIRGRDALKKRRGGIKGLIERGAGE